MLSTGSINGRDSNDGIALNIFVLVAHFLHVSLTRVDLRIEKKNTLPKPWFFTNIRILPWE